MKVAFLIDVLLEAGGGNSAVLVELNIIEKLNIKRSSSLFELTIGKVMAEAFASAGRT